MGRRRKAQQQVQIIRADKMSGTNNWAVMLVNGAGMFDRHKVYGDLHYTCAGTAIVMRNDCVVLGIKRGWGFISVDDDND
jgi:hypothetical protein